ncbi:hypothetical protein ACFYWY_34515 [Streptomyces sp. NPDC002870]|uniref:hypothetical protein n=1 Tax=Streptomyces sp. NPDC002870 TaxID=3364666 RepID=UPI0036B37FAF
MASITEPEKSGSSGKKTAAPGAEGVQLRLDSSEEEKRLIHNAWSTCLKKNGVPTYAKQENGPDPGGGEWIWPEFKSPAMRGAAEKCKSKKPLQPPELVKEKNPNYMDDFREWLQCMDKRGVKTNAIADGSGWNYVGTQPPNAYEIEEECKVEAFSDKK